MPDPMEIEKTGEFDKDTKKLTVKDKERLDKVVSEIAYSNKKGKQMHHLKDVFSIRFDNKRLVYRLIEKENKLILLMLKSREGVYAYLK